MQVRAALLCRVPEEAIQRLGRWQGGQKALVQAYLAYVPPSALLAAAWFDTDSDNDQHSAFFHPRFCVQVRPVACTLRVSFG